MRLRRPPSTAGLSARLDLPGSERGGSRANPTVASATCGTRRMATRRARVAPNNDDAANDEQFELPYAVHEGRADRGVWGGVSYTTFAALTTALSSPGNPERLMRPRSAATCPTPGSAACVRAVRAEDPRRSLSAWTSRIASLTRTPLTFAVCCGSSGRTGSSVACSRRTRPRRDGRGADHLLADVSRCAPPEAKRDDEVAGPRIEALRPREVGLVTLG